MFYNDEDGDSFKALNGLVLFWFKDMFLPTWVFLLFFVFRPDLPGRSTFKQTSAFF